MNHTPIRLGPLALLLTVISICMTTLAVLTFSTARADLSLARCYADTVSIRYALERQGQEYLRAVRSAPQGVSEEDGVLWQTFEDGDMSLTIGLAGARKPGDEVRVVSWQYRKHWEEDDEIGGLWTGF